MAISKKIRFEVFKRDGFQCGYCGKTPPEIILEVDHINPKSKKGKDDINNLITACFDCNRGKSNIMLDKIPNKLNENFEILKQKEEQIKEYRKFIKTIEKRIKKDIRKIEIIFQTICQDKEFTDIFKNSIKRFLNYLPFGEVEDAMYISLSHFKDNYDPAIPKYFCGVCWNKIRNRNNG